jgi:hypothetical protein
MNNVNDRKGFLILGAIVVIAIALSLAVYLATGDRGIEDRFLDAAGIHGGADASDHAGTGFSLEGNPVVYGAILVILGIACIAAYRYFKI